MATIDGYCCFLEFLCLNYAELFACFVLIVVSLKMLVNKIPIYLFKYLLKICLVFSLFKDLGIHRIKRGKTERLDKLFRIIILKISWFVSLIIHNSYFVHLWSFQLIFSFFRWTTRNGPSWTSEGAWTCAWVMNTHTTLMSWRNEMKWWLKWMKFKRINTILLLKPYYGTPHLTPVYIICCCWWWWNKDGRWRSEEDGEFIITKTDTVKRSLMTVLLNNTCWMNAWMKERRKLIKSKVYDKEFLILLEQ